MISDDQISELAESLGYRMAHLAVAVEAAGRDLERLRLRRLRDRDDLGLPFVESVPTGKRLVPTGRVTVCCDCHGGACPAEPCCAECTTTV